MRETLRMQAVQSPVIPIVADLIRAHPSTISLGQGVSYYGPPPQVREAVDGFFADPMNHRYQPVHGIPELLDLIESKLVAENNISLDSRRIVVTAGANMGFMNAVLAITDPADEIILLCPYYFNYDMAIAIAGCRAVVVNTDENYQPQLDAIESAITDRTRAIVTISPNNPTGAVYDEATLRSINRLCRERGLCHISDEAYENFVYDGAEHFSSGSIDDSADHTISLYSLSKAYGFASWRIGYMVIPENLFERVRKIQDTNLICPPVISQFAAAAALRVGSKYCREKLTAIADVRRLVIDQLKPLEPRVHVPTARGAFYFLIRVDTSLLPMQAVEQLVANHKVAVIPGDTFGIDGCYLRIAYGALEKATVEEGMSRLVEGLKTITE